MTYQALYRVWRPQRFDEIVGQDIVSRTLKNAVSTKQISHAYLFTGPRGTGKTSAAKILAKAVNCPNSVNGEPCNDCDICRGITEGSLSDVIEIDAASNNGVEEIRDIRDKARYAPTEATYKVYIIDEVHMLSTGAFNALLKTLEEPPENVIFILATTEPHKIPATIISRTQRFDFKRIQDEDIVSRMAHVLDEEEIPFEDKALRLIARIANGGMRDALSLLDQTISFHPEEVTMEYAVAVTGSLSEQWMSDYVEALGQKDSQSALSYLHDMLDEGKESSRLVEEMILFCRDLLIAKQVKNPENDSLTMTYREGFYDLAKKLSTDQIYVMLAAFNRAQDQMRFSNQATVYLEMATISIASGMVPNDNSDELLSSDQSTLITDLQNQVQQLTLKVNQLSQALENQVKQVQTVQTVQATQAVQTNPVQQEMPTTKVEMPVSQTNRSTLHADKIFHVLSMATKPAINQVKNVWDDLLHSLSVQERAILRSSEPVAASSDYVVISFQYDLLAEKATEDKVLQANIQTYLQNYANHGGGLIALTEASWLDARKRYVEANRNQEVDRLLKESDENEENQVETGIIENRNEDQGTVIQTDNPLVSEAVKLFGQENVEIVED